MRKSWAIRLLVISNVLVALASAAQGFALFLHVDSIAYIASGVAVIGALLAIWQWIQANREQSQAIDRQIEWERAFTDAKIGLERDTHNGTLIILEAFRASLPLIHLLYKLVFKLIHRFRSQGGDA